MWSLTDDSLLAGLASGDSTAATAFVRRHQGRVYGLALAIVKDASTAEDVAQEAFVRVWRYAEAFDPRRGSVVTWVLTITRSVAIDVLRGRRQEPVDPETLSGLQGALSERGPEERPVEVDERARISRALEELPNDQRRALLLAAFYGCSAREIGDMEHIPLGTAKTRIRAGLMKMRTKLEVGDE
ncbi:sigma-70 family RNA polymerase sigma factor [soil metagenome]